MHELNNTSNCQINEIRQWPTHHNGSKQSFRQFMSSKSHWICFELDLQTHSSRCYKIQDGTHCVTALMQPEIPELISKNWHKISFWTWQKPSHQDDVAWFKMQCTVQQLWCSQRVLLISKTDRRSLFELNKKPLIKMTLQDSRCDVLCDNSDAARDFCWSQKPNSRSLSELEKNLLIKMMLQDSRCNISGFLSYGDRVVEVFGRCFHRSVQQHSICFNLMIFRPWNPHKHWCVWCLGR
jgi:hypothetical protein